MTQFSQLPRLTEGYFEQSPFAVRLTDAVSNDNTDSTAYKVVDTVVLMTPTSCRVTSNTLVGVNGTVENGVLILQ